jgi:hypothetical protein
MEIMQWMAQVLDARFPKSQEGTTSRRRSFMNPDIFDLLSYQQSQEINSLKNEVQKLQADEQRIRNLSSSVQECDQGAGKTAGYILKVNAQYS